MAKKQSKTRRFEVPKDFIGSFFTALEETDLSSELIEVSEDDEIIVEIEYVEQQRDDVMNLIELLDEYLAQLDDEEEEDDDD